MVRPKKDIVASGVEDAPVTVEAVDIKEKKPADRPAGKRKEKETAAEVIPKESLKLKDKKPAGRPAGGKRKEKEPPTEVLPKRTLRSNSSKATLTENPIVTSDVAPAEKKSRKVPAKAKKVEEAKDAPSSDNVKKQTGDQDQNDENIENEEDMEVEVPAKSDAKADGKTKVRKKNGVAPKSDKAKGKEEAPSSDNVKKQAGDQDQTEMEVDTVAKSDGKASGVTKGGRKKVAAKSEKVTEKEETDI